MSDEILKLRGRLAAAEQLVPALISGIDIDIDEARGYLDRYETKTALRTERIVIIANRLDSAVKRLRQLEEQISALKSDLGE